MVLVVLAWILSVSGGLMAGVYFAFSGFILRAFGSMGPERAVDAMNAINMHILSSVFMPLFFGSTLVALLLVVAGVWSWGDSASTFAIVGGLTYLLGMFGVTALFNVPLNEALSRVSGNSEDAQGAWAAYSERWARWNSLRGVACVVTVACCLPIV